MQAHYVRSVIELVTPKIKKTVVNVISKSGETAETAAQFILFRDLLNFVRSMLLFSAGGKGDVIGSDEIAKKFSYSELLRIAILLMRDDDVVNRAEHQRMAVEIALLKAATFPRLREIENVLSGSVATGFSRSGPTEAGPHTNSDLETFFERVRKARPAIAGYLGNAKSTKKDNLISFIFNDTYSADAVTDAHEALEKIAREVYGAPTSIVVQTEAKTAPKEEAPLREDPILKAFQKHLGGEVVESRRSK